MGAKNLHRWTRNSIEDVKASIKDAVDALPDYSARVTWLNEKIAGWKASPDPHEQLQCYVCIVTLLVRDLRAGRLTTRQISQLVETAEGFLLLQGIEPPHSTLSYLYSDLHMVLSQLAVMKGDHFLASWEQQLALRLNQSLLKENPQFANLSQGLRAIRGGHASVARPLLANAIESGEKNTWHWRATLELAKLSRYRGDLFAARDMLQGLVADQQAAASFCKEAQWDLTIADCTPNDPVSSLLPLVRKNREFHSYNYIYEVFLKTRIVADDRWMKLYSSPEKIAFNRALTPHKRSELYRFCKALSAAYDDRVPLSTRLNRFGPFLDLPATFPSIEFELLGKLAVIRWLIRSGNHYQADLMLSEYRSLSLRLSEETSGDVLHFFSR